MAVTRLIVALLVAALFACNASPDRLTVLEGGTMGTRYAVKIVDLPRAVDAATLNVQIDAELARIEAQMSTYLADSELTRFNDARSTDWMSISPQLLDVLEEARSISVLTSGAFDVTVGPLVNLWGFGPDPRRDVVPDDGAIDAARARVGFERLETRSQPPAARKARADLYVDLSAIAKGYAADRVAALLDARGVPNYVVAISGDLHTRGLGPDDAPWSVAVEQPVPGTTRRVERLLRLDGAGVATSGNYRSLFTSAGRDYSHIIDPATGRPVTHDLASVTIIAETTMRADALATALMVLGADAGYEVAVREGIAALMIRRVGDEIVERWTPAFDAYIDRRPLNGGQSPL